MKISVRAKLLVAFLAISVVSLVLVSVVLRNVAKESLVNETFAKLNGVKEAKAQQVESYFWNVKEQLLSFSKEKTVVDSLPRFKEAFPKAVQEFSAAEKEQLMKDFEQVYRKFAGTITERKAQISIADYTPTAENEKLMQALYIVDGENFDGPEKGSYAPIHKEYHPIFRDFLLRFGYYDIFLVDHETGEIIYSVYKEMDFASNLYEGVHKDSGIARVVKKAKEAAEGSFVIDDFVPYVPSYNAAASFAATPVFSAAGERLGTLVFQMPVGKINEILTGLEDVSSAESKDGHWRELGLGDSGEVYLVGRDKKVRNEMRMWLEEQKKPKAERSFMKALGDAGIARAVIDTVERQGQTLGVLEVDTEPVRVAFAEEKGELVAQDYRNESVFSVFRRLKIAGLDWLILCEIDEGEALEPVAKMTRFVVYLMSFILVVVFIVAYFLASKISRPLVEMNKVTKLFAEGDFTHELKVGSQDEVGEVAESINRSAESLSGIIQNVQASGQKVLQSSNEISESSTEIHKSSASVKDFSQSVASSSLDLTSKIEDVAGVVDEMSGKVQDISGQAGLVSQAISSVVVAIDESQENISSIASATEEMSATANEIASSAESGRTVTAQAVSAVESANQQVKDLLLASDEIENVLGVISEISEQVKNLALNATIEAARAGEAGKGFAVVANEVKDLARQTGEATENVKRSVDQMRVSSNKTNESMVSITGVMSDVNNVMNDIASAIEEQSIALRNNSENTSQASQRIMEISENMTESDGSVKQIADVVDDLAEKSLNVTTFTKETVETTKDVSSSIQEIDKLVEHFQSDGDLINQAAQSLLSLSQDLNASLRHFKCR